MDNYIKFLGTAGARFVMIKQLRASGGIWISSAGINLLIDPGPGSIVRCASSRPKLDPGKLDAIILTHRHLDHANDINVMIEAMTEGGFKKRGIVFCPQDAIDNDSVILKYAQSLPEKIEFLKEDRKYKVKDFEFETSMQLVHPVETFGLKFKIKDKVIALLTDTKYFKGLDKFFSDVDVLIICVVFLKPHPAIEHLSLVEAEQLIKELKPRKVVLTHFGMTMLKAKPYTQAEEMAQRLGIEITAARDGEKISW